MLAVHQDASGRYLPVCENGRGPHVVRSLSGGARSYDGFIASYTRSIGKPTYL